MNTLQVIINKPDELTSITPNKALSPNERKFLNIAISKLPSQEDVEKVIDHLQNEAKKIGEDTKGFEDLSIVPSCSLSFGEVEALLNSKERRGELVRTVEPFLSELCKMRVQINVLNKVKNTNIAIDFAFFQSVHIDLKNRTLKIWFSKDMFELIYKSKIYTKLDLMVLRGLRTSYSIVMYEIFASYLNSPKPKTITISELKNLLSINDKERYKKSSMLIKNLLIPTLKEIEEKTDLIPYFEEIKGHADNGKLQRRKSTIAIKIWATKKEIKGIDPKPKADKKIISKNDFIDLLRKNYRGLIPYKRADGYRTLVSIYDDEKGNNLAYDFMSPDCKDLSKMDALSFYDYVYKTQAFRDLIIQSIDDNTSKDNFLSFKQYAIFLLKARRFKGSKGFYYTAPEFLEDGTFKIKGFEDEGLTKDTGGYLSNMQTKDHHVISDLKALRGFIQTATNEISPVQVQKISSKELDMDDFL